MTFGRVANLAKEIAQISVYHKVSLKPLAESENKLNCTVEFLSVSKHVKFEVDFLISVQDYPKGVKSTRVTNIIGETK